MDGLLAITMSGPRALPARVEGSARHGHRHDCPACRHRPCRPPAGRPRDLQPREEDRGGKGRAAARGLPAALLRQAALPDLRLRPGHPDDSRARRPDGQFRHRASGRPRAGSPGDGDRPARDGVFDTQMALLHHRRGTGRYGRGGDHQAQARPPARRGPFAGRRDRARPGAARACADPGAGAARASWAGPSPCPR